MGGAPIVAMAAVANSPDEPQKLAAALAPAASLSAAQIMSLKSDAPFCEECERCKDGVCEA